MNEITLHPLQERFLSSPCDIKIFGGAAGCGKSMSILLDAIRYKDDPAHNALIFRRTRPQIVKPGALWTQAQKLYSRIGKPKPNNVNLSFTWSSGACVSFGSCMNDDFVHNYHSAEIPMIVFDELQQFTEYIFWYLFSRLRSPETTYMPYVLGTCNPDPDSFLCSLLDQAGYIDTEGYGVDKGVTYFVRDHDEIIFNDNKEELEEKYEKLQIKSFIFIPGKLEDNPTLDKDGLYRSALLSMPEFLIQRLLKGNWKTRPTKGTLFKKIYFNYIESYDKNDVILSVRCWDRAGTEEDEELKQNSRTAGIKAVLLKNKSIVITDAIAESYEIEDVLKLVRNTAVKDGRDTVIIGSQDPAQAGKAEATFFKAVLQGYSVFTYPKTFKKLTAWLPLLTGMKEKKVFVLRGYWNNSFEEELLNATGNKKERNDQVDAAAEAFIYLTDPKNIRVGGSFTIKNAIFDNL